MNQIKTKQIIASTIILASILCVCVGSSSAWLSYDHRMEVTINNGGGGTLTNYQFNFTNDTNILVSAGHMQADGADCRITDASDNLLPFWNETPFNAADTKIWVNGTLTTGDNTFYMYYGDAGASAASDISTTFMIGDDFNNDSKLAWLGGDYTTFNDGHILQSRTNSGDAAWNGANISDGWVEVTTNITGDDGSANEHHAGPYFRMCAPGGSGYDNYVFMSDAFYNNVRLVKQVGGPETILDTVAATINYNQDYVLRAEFTGSRIVCYLDGVEKINLTDPDLEFGRTGVHIYDCTAKFTNFSAYDGTTTFRDDFSHSTLLAGQGQTYSMPDHDDNSYVIEEGVLKCIGRYNTHTELHYFKNTFTDCIVEANTIMTEDPNAFGLSVRSSDNDNFYGQMCRGSTYDYVRSFKMVGGSFTTLSQTAKAFDPGMEYLLRVVANGNSLKTYVDNTLYLSDTDTAFASGYIGFYHYTTNISYDDFRVRQYTAIEPTSSLGAEENAPSAGEHVPPTPVDLLAETGNFWVHHTWGTGSGNITDSFRILVNGSWHNSTNSYHHNDGLSAHVWSNITVYAWNNSGTGSISSGYVSVNTQIPNNPVLITGGSPWSGDIGENVMVDFGSTDIDTDLATYSCARTDLFTDFDTGSGTGSWSVTTNGTYYIDFGVYDGYGSQSNYTMEITVGGITGGETTSFMELTNQAKTAFGLSNILIIVIIASALLTGLFIFSQGQQIEPDIFIKAVVLAVVLIIILYFGITIVETISSVLE